MKIKLNNIIVDIIDKQNNGKIFSSFNFSPAIDFKQKVEELIQKNNQYWELNYFKSECLDAFYEEKI